MCFWFCTILPTKDQSSIFLFRFGTVVDMVLGFRKRGQEPEVTMAQSVHSSEDAVSSSNEKSGEVVDTTVAVETLKDFSKMHKLDPNLPLEELDQVDDALRTGNAEKELAIERALVEDNSPYPEVCRRFSLKKVLD